MSGAETLVQMRTLRRFSHYNAGEMIAMPLDAARDLAARRLAEPLNLLVPTTATPREAAPDGDPPPAPVPRAQPASLVRK